MNNRYYGVDIRTIDSLAAADLLSQILAGNMRKEDREELEAQGRMPYGGLYESMTTSIEAYYAIHERMPLAAFGIGLCPEGCSIWMLGTTMCERHKKALVACMQVHQGQLEEIQSSYQLHFQRQHQSPPRYQKDGGGVRR